MRIYDIWSEGSYWEGHPRHKDFFVASMWADSFDDAVRDYIKSYAAKSGPDPQIRKREDGWVWMVGHKVCKLFDKKSEIREEHREIAVCEWKPQYPKRKPQTFKYSLALEHLMAGNRVARSEWVDRNQYLFLMKSNMFDDIAMPYGIGGNGETITDQIWIKTSKGLVGPYSGCNCDTVAEDWVIY